MSRFLKVLCVVWTLVLMLIAVELYRIDQSLAWLSAPIRELAALGRSGSARTASVETEAERKARIQAEQLRFERDMEYHLSAAEHKSPRSSTARPVAPPADPSRPGGTAPARREP